LKVTKAVLSFACVAVLFASVGQALCWSNGGWSANPADPDYGTHDWIAQHALNYLPAEEKQYLTDHLEVYLFGTELPDLPASQGGIGDTTKHHVYFSESGVLTDDISAQRAQDMYVQALEYLRAGDYVDAAEAAGAMTHYIADVAVFGHVMGASTPWGTEIHHSDYETYVTSQTQTYTSIFSSALAFDGNLATVTAYNATVNLAYDTTFGGADHLTCNWMDNNYDWDSPTFSGRCGQSLNLAVNAAADVLHSLYVEAKPTQTPTPTSTASATPSSSATPATPEFPAIPALLAAMASVLAVAVLYKKRVNVLS
jgi:hypothetical protein